MSPWDVLGWLLVIVIGVPTVIVCAALVVTAAFVIFSFIAAMCISVVERMKAHRRRVRAQEE